MSRPPVENLLIVTSWYRFRYIAIFSGPKWVLPPVDDLLDHLGTGVALGNARKVFPRLKV